MAPEPPPIQQALRQKRSPLWAALLAVGAIVGVTVCGVVVRGCMTEHTRGLNDIAYDVSPDGRTIVFAGAGNGGSDLYLFDLASHRVTSLISSDDYETCPSFSRDGKRLAFTRGMPGIRADQLCVIDLPSRTIVQLTDADENVSSPVFLPDGRRILCTIETEYRWGGLASSWDEGGELRIVDIKTRKQTPLRTPSVPAFRPRVSADGKWIGWVAGEAAYVSPLRDDVLRPSMVMGSAAHLALNADGTRVAVSAGQYSPDFKIYLGDRMGKSRRSLTGSVGGCFDPVFSPDGKYVYFLAEKWLTGATGVPTSNLMRVASDGSQLIKIFPHEVFTNPQALLEK